MAKAKSIKILAGQERKAKSAEARKYTAEKIPEDLKRKVEYALLEATRGVADIAKEFGLSNHTVSQIRIQAEDKNPALNDKKWKNHTAATLRHFTTRGVDRLVAEVDRIPLANLCVSVAIAIDKIATLADQPTTVVEHRLRVDHGGVESMMKRANAETADTVSDVCDDKVIDIPNKEA